MCLSRITDRNPKSEGEGYIVVKSRNKKLYGVFYGGRRLTGRWLNERDFRPGIGCDYISFSDGLQYSKGFHIHLGEEEAQSFLRGDQLFGSSVVRKVKYRKSVVVGRQSFDGGFIVVAKEMYIYPGKIK